MSKEAERLSERLRKNRQQAEDRRSRAQIFARKLALEFACADPGLKSVTGFGSAFEPWRRYRQDSDIDLAICGGNWGLLWSLIPKSEFSVSLVELDLQSDVFSEQVHSQGVILYER